jgi:hypothetical protein
MSADDDAGGRSAENVSEATQYLRAHPDLRDRVHNSKDFKAWRKRFKQIDVDSIRYFVLKGEPMVSGGDRLLDEDELMLEWAQMNGLVGR